MSDEKNPDREKLIRSKQAAGLSRKQAEAVVADQEAHDAELAKSAAPKAKGKTDK
jgi:hypothetical protein